MSNKKKILHVKKSKQIISLFERVKKLLDAKKPKQALGLSEKGISLLPDRIAFYRCKARALYALKRYEEAAATLEPVTHLFAEDPAAYLDLGEAYISLKKYEESQAAFMAAASHGINTPPVYIGIGNGLRMQRNYGEAIGYYRLALAATGPNDLNRTVALTNLGVALTEAGEFDEGLLLLQEAMQADPTNHGACYNAFLAAKHKGLPYEAAHLYELAFFPGVRVPFRKFPHMQRWNGEDISDKRLLIWREQGVGDEIYYSQLYHWAIAQAGEVIIEADKRLIPLFQRSFPSAKVIPEDSRRDAERTDADYHIPAAAIPLACGSSEATKAAMDFPGGWLVPDPERVALWRERLGALPGMKVGISWRSRSLNIERSWYYFSLEQALPLLKTPAVTWINQQYHDAGDEIRQLQEAHGVTIHDWDDIDLMNDLDEVTAFMSALDLLITAGTSPMFLAKCVGTPTWTVYPHAPRPLMGPTKAYWDHEPGGQTFFRHWQEDWDTVLVRVSAELQKLVKARESSMA